MRDSDSYPGAALSELDIQAYVDGALDPRQAGRVSHYLGAAPEEARRVAFYHRLNAQMQREFPKLTEAKTKISGRFDGIGRMTSKRRQAGFLALALVTGGLILGGMALVTRPNDLLLSSGVMAFEDAAAVEQASEPSCAAGDTACLAASKAYAPDLTAVGFHVTGRGHVALRYFLSATETVYRNDAGQAAVLLSMPNWRAEQAQWQARRVGTIRVLSWTHRGVFYELVGQSTTRGLMKAADLAVFAGDDSSSGARSK